MDMIRDYLAMGGYASFVWPAFALSALVLTFLLASSLRGLRRSERALAAAEASRTTDEDQTI